MLKLGLTGSIATGKSTVLKAFADLGVPVFSSDEAVHRLYAGAEGATAVGAAFPAAVHDGVVDREALSALLVADPSRIIELEAIVHPLVRRSIATFLADSEKAGAPLAVVDIPLLYEGGHDYGLDEVAVTVVDEATQRRRAMARTGMTVEKLDTILARQLPQGEKRRRADHVFETSGSIPETRAEVREFVEAVRARRQGRA